MTSKLLSSAARARFLCGLLCLASLGSLSGCAALRARPVSIDTLRRKAAENPKDAEAQKRWASAELFAERGDAARALGAIKSALALSPKDAALWLELGIERAVHGEPAEALQAFLRSLEWTPSAPTQRDLMVAEVSAKAIDDLKDVTPNAIEKSRARLLTILRRHAPRLSAEAAFTLSQIATEFAFRRGDMKEVDALLGAQGCVRRWKMAGPFGPHELLGFDATLPAEAPGPLRASYDLGPGRGVRATREIEARGCLTSLNHPVLEEGGSSVALASADLKRSGHYLLRVETNHAAQVSVDGKVVVRLDARRFFLPRITYHSLKLPAGKHEIRVKVASRQAGPSFALALWAASDAQRALEDSLRASPLDDELTKLKGLEPKVQPLDGYLVAASLLARGDIPRVRHLLESKVESEGSSASMSLLAALATLSDALLPEDLRRDEARRHLTRAQRRDPKAWYPPLQLARLSVAEGRALDAIRSLRRATERWPRSLGLRMALAELLLARGWEAEADRVIAQARRAVPGSCLPLQVAFSAAQKQEKGKEAGQLADALAECDARNNSRLLLRLAQRRWAEASRELERIAQLEPRQTRLQSKAIQLELANGKGDSKTVDALLRELSQAMPRSSMIARARLDRQIAAGDLAGAKAQARALLAKEPTAMESLRALQRLVLDDFELAPYRLDGPAIVRDFERSGRSYEEPQVMVLDSTVVRVFDDGSSLELTHNIFRVQSQEAVDQHGEYEIPEGARLLTLRTLKADGRKLEPDLLAGKESLSLPNLAPGDYVESEYLRFSPSPPSFMGGYVGNRFYFRNYEVPFDRSELTVLLPKSLRPLFDPRGKAPAREESTRGDLRVMRWRVIGSKARAPEPASVNPREFIPSINLGVHASWGRFVTGIRDVLADRAVYSPSLRRFAETIVGKEGDPEKRAKKLYSWVVENIDENPQAFGLAPHMMAARAGNRARVLHYLLGLLDIPSDLVLVRSVAADQTRSTLADEDSYNYLVVRLRLEGADRWLYTGERFAPFAYLPPALRGQDALLLAERPQMLRLPGRDFEDLRRIEVTLTLRNDKEAEAEIREELHGAVALAWRQQLEAIPPALLRSRFEEGYLSQLLPGASLRALKVHNQKAVDRPLILAYRATLSSLGRKGEGRWYLGALFPSMLSARYAQVAQRRTTELVAPPLAHDIRIRLRLPASMKIDQAASALVLRSPLGMSFEARWRPEKGEWVAERRLRLPLKRVKPSDYRRFAEFCRQVDRIEARETSVVQRGGGR